MVYVLVPTDLVGVSFFVTCMALLASTVFFFAERGDVAVHWRTSMTVAGLVTGVAFVHYYYMRQIWVAGLGTPTVFRYVDWFITVPLQIIEFYLILVAVGFKGAGLFVKLLLASTLMLVFGYFGEVGLANAWLCFILGMAAWIYILYEIFFGEAGQFSAKSNNLAGQQAFNTIRLIVTIGWAIYPIGYFLGYLNGALSEDLLNLVYNLADFVNKIAFGLAIWSAAKLDTKKI
jgi:bacteriorhodopsin